MEKVAKKPSPEQLLRASQIPNTARQTLAMITPSRASIRAKSKLQGWTPERLDSQPSGCDPQFSWSLRRNLVRFANLAQPLPTFPIHCVLGLSFSWPWIQLYSFDPLKHRHRNHIPQIFRHDVRHQHIDFLQAILSLSIASGRTKHIAPILMRMGSRFHLHPPQPCPRIYNQIVRPAVAPGLRNAKSHPRRLM